MYEFANLHPRSSAKVASGTCLLRVIPHEAICCSSVSNLKEDNSKGFCRVRTPASARLFCLSCSSSTLQRGRKACRRGLLSDGEGSPHMHFTGIDEAGVDVLGVGSTGSPSRGSQASREARGPRSSAIRYLRLQNLAAFTRLTPLERGIMPWI